MITAIEYLHTEMNLVHRDLKPGNIMLTDQDYIKVIDFGDSVIMDSRTSETSSTRNIRKSTFVGTAMYVAPEMLQYTESGFFSDFWAIGNIIFELS